MKSGILYLQLFFILLMAYGHPALAGSQTLDFEQSVDTAYLPYRSYDARDEFISRDCSYPEHTLLKVIYPAISDSREGLFVLSNNHPPNSGNFGIFTPRTFPGFDVTDDDPIRYTITNWTLTPRGVNNDPTIIGVCHNQDTIFTFRLVVDSDSVVYAPLYIKQSQDERDVPPLAHVLYVGDFDLDGNKEIFLSVYNHTFFRRLFLIDYNSLQVKWQKSVSSGINSLNFNVIEDEVHAGVLFTTGNSANGVVDSVFNDYYSYITRLDKNGDIVFNKISSRYGHRAPFLIPSINPRSFYVTHYLDFETGDSSLSKHADEYYLSEIDQYGNIIQSVNIKSTPTNMWLMPHGEDDKRSLFVLFNSKAISRFNTDLQLLEEAEPLEKSIKYIERVKIAGENDSVYVFSDGLYDTEFNKLLQFHFNSGEFIPLEYDSAGNLKAYVIIGYYRYYIGYIQKKTNIELAMVFYHRNESVVLVFLTSLIVGIVLTNIFRARSRSNLLLISRQKVELEKTHQSLKDAQARIVAQEKYRQAKDIAGGFAHEIRNRLFPARSVLKKLIHMSRKDSISNERVHEICQIADESLHRTILLTDDISEYTDLKLDGSIENSNINLILEEVLVHFENQIENQQVLVEKNILPDFSVQIDKKHLFIVFSQLVSNALNAMVDVKNPKLDISAVVSSSCLVIDVSDNGIGIDSENLKKIYELFYSSNPAEGSGIGLAKVSKILELYNAEIAVNSENSIGTTFSVRFKTASKSNII